MKSYEFKLIKKDPCLPLSKDNVNYFCLWRNEDTCLWGKRLRLPREETLFIEDNDTKNFLDPDSYWVFTLQLKTN